MKIIVLFIMLSFGQNAYSQFVEKVYLKDSLTVYEGWIIEQVPQDYVKILRFKERDTLTVQVGEIWKISRIINVKKINSIFKNPIPDFSGRQQGVFLELLGNAGLYSFNYDTRIKKGKRDGWGVRIGFSYLSIKDSSSFGTLTASTFALPVDINYLVGRRRSALELGAGATFVSSRYKGTKYNYNELEFYGSEAFNITPNGLFGYINLGYRYRSIANGLLFRITFTPIIVPEFLPGIGLSLGYSFKRK